MSSHPKLIQANIALFTGAYAEARRLLHEARVSGSVSPENAPMVLWLDAQSQEDPNERLSRLRTLIAQVPSENLYAHMARQTLADEEDHAAHMRSAQFSSILPNLKVWQWIAAATAVIAVMVLVMTLSVPDQAIDTNPTPTVNAMTVPTALLEDNSRPLDPTAHTGRYSQGILQITRVEDASRRVIDTQTDNRISPIDGARFYTLQIAFECRSGVCDQPPEANLALQLDDNIVIVPRDEVSIVGEGLLTPVALGRVTTGWIVFEIPLISTPLALIISARDNQAFDPISIGLMESP